MTNDRLASWLDRSGLSRGELARRVKAKALLWNEPHVATSTTRVRFWIEGQIPRQPLPDIIAAVFSDHFGYRVTTYDLGLGEGAGAERALVYNSSYAATVEVVADLGRADVDRRNFLAGVPFAALAGVGPSRDWLMNTLDQSPARPPRTS